MSALLPGEEIWSVNEWKPGDRAVWTRSMRGGYGYTEAVNVEVVSVGKERIRVRAQRRDGEWKTVSVMPRNLRTPTGTAPGGTP
jgi:hypothetical protein